MKIAFFDAKPHDRQFFDAANAHHHFQLRFFSERLSVKTCILADGCDAICVFVNDAVTAEIIAILTLKGIRLIALRSSGYNHVDLKAASHKISVVRVPEYSPYSVAEYAVGMMLALNRKIPQAYQRVKENNFSIEGLLGFDMHGKTAGVIGAGRIGKAVIRILKGFGMHILAYDVDKTQVEQTGCPFVKLDDLYAQSDIISLHCPLTSENRHMIDQTSLAKMKDGVMLINTGRGALVHTDELIRALESGKVGAAGLDVYENEAPYFYQDLSSRPIDDPLIIRLQTLPNVLLTSHQAFFTKEALQDIASTTLASIQEFADGKPLKNQILA